MKSTLIISSLVLLSCMVQAQYAEDALRFSEIFYQGTARNMAIGSALGSMGGDFSTLSTNPAGLGIYRNNEISLSPEIFNRKITSTYNGTVSEDARTIFDISNFGLVTTKKLGRGASGWKYVNFGFGMNRLNNYNSNSLIQGMNDLDSRIDVYIRQTDAYLNNDGGSLSTLYEYDAFYIDPAWQTYLMDTIAEEDGNVYLVSPVPAGGIQQSKYTETRGSNNEWLMSIGGNFNDKLYIGATLGLPYIRYYSESVYAESDPLNNAPDFDRWSVTDFLNTEGWGVNFKIGLIARPIDWMRIGVAYHTPTYYWSMRDNWYTVTTSDIYAYSLGKWHQDSYTSPAGEFEYKLVTPMRFIANVGFVIKNTAFITGEYENVNYSNAKFKSDSYKFSSENNEISNSFTSSNNFKVGAEYRYSNLSFRGGYALYASPYNDNLNDGKRQSLSGGIGLKYSKLGIDFAYVYSKMDTDYYLYSYNYIDNNGDPQIIETNAAKNKIASQNFVLTFTYRY